MTSRHQTHGHSPEGEPATTENGALSSVTHLLDHACGVASEVVAEVDDLRRVAADTNQPLDKRLEAFEDIIDSEVGDTTMIRARNIEREVGLRQIYLKFEGGNPTGTQKDRIAFAQALDALRRGFDTITVATCGNYGVAQAFAASLAGLHCIIFMPRTYTAGRTKEMIELNAEIRYFGDDYEAALDASRTYGEESQCYDANPGGDNTSLQLTAYGTISYEIYDELRDAPMVVAAPVSNGTTLAGVYKGFLSLYRRGKVSRLPRMVAGSSFKKNPIVQAHLNGYAACPELPPQHIHGTKINEPLINWRSVDGEYALDSLRKTNGWATNASDKAMVSISKLIREREGLHVLPASTAGLIALVNRHKTEPLPSDRYVVILTGRKS